MAIGGGGGTAEGQRKRVSGCSGSYAHSLEGDGSETRSLEQSRLMSVVPKHGSKDLAQTGLLKISPRPTYVPPTVSVLDLSHTWM